MRSSSAAKSSNFAAVPCPSSARLNVYVVARLLWPRDRQSSSVLWGCALGADLRPGLTARGVYALSPELLERLKEKNSTVEVWEKRASADRDRLIGLATLSLHQLYLSFKDAPIRKALLHSKVTRADSKGTGVRK